MKRRASAPAPVPSRDDLARLVDAQTLLALVASRPAGPMPDLDVDRAIVHLRGVLAFDVLLRARGPRSSACPSCEATDGDHAVHCPRATEAP